MNKLLYGSALRAKKNKKKIKDAKLKVQAEMPGLIYDLMGSLQKDPVEEGSYNSELEKFQELLKDRYPDITRLRFAYNVLARHIADGNDQGKWKLDIPRTIQSIPRTTSSRTHANFNAGRIVGGLYQAWVQKVGIEKYSSCPKDRLADVLISAIFYGGLANPRAVASLANALIGESRPLQIADGSASFAWIELILRGDTDPLNHRAESQDGEDPVWQTLHRFYPDNRTLGHILLFQFVKASPEINALGELDQIEVWEIIARRIGRPQDIKFPASLAVFCQGAQTITESLAGVELPQALLECAAGRVGSVALPPKFLKNWLLGDLNDATPEIIFPQDVQRFQVNSAAKKVQKKSSVKSLELSYSTTPTDLVVEQIRSALKTNVSGKKNTSSSALKALAEIAQQDLSLNASILVSWLVDCLSARKVKVSSASRYFSELGCLWLFYTNEVDIDDLDESEIEHLYGQILESKPSQKRKSLNYLHGRLHDLHRFACDSGGYGLPRLESFFENSSHTITQSQIRAGYIPEHNYRAMIKNVDRLAGTDPDTKEGFAVLLILAYRTGMRRGELLKLRLSEIENSDENWIHVVNNRYGNIKSDSARRRIPVYLLLLPWELSRFRQYVKKRRSQNENQINTLLFSEPHAVTVPHDGNRVSALAKALLFYQGLGDLTFHHLRHSAMTNLMIVMEEVPDLIGTLTAYSPEQASKIRSELFCTSSLCSRDKYSAIAGLAGHLSPDTTFLHYFHETSLLVWRRLSMYDPVLEKTQLSRLTGLSAQLINSTFKGNDSDTKLSCLRKEMLERLSLISITHAVKNLESVTPDEHQHAPRKARPTVSDCYAVLRDLENGDSIAIISLRYGIEESKIKSWFEAAEAMYALKTKSGNSRHFHGVTKSTVIGILLAPIKPQDRATAAETDKLINLLREAYAKDNMAISWCIEYWKNNTSTTKPGTRFTCPRDAAKFINLLESAIPKSRWELKLILTRKTHLEQLASWNSIGISLHREEAMQGKSVQAYLRLRHVNEKLIVDKRKGIKTFSSQLIDYVFHMLAIMVGVSLSEKLSGVAATERDGDLSAG